MAKHVLPPAGPLKGRSTGKLNIPPQIIKRANAVSNTKFKAATRPSTPSANPSKARVTGKSIFADDLKTSRVVSESRIRAHTRAKTSLLPGQNTTDKLKGSSRVQGPETSSLRSLQSGKRQNASPTFRAAAAAQSKSKNLAGTVNKLKLEIQSKKAQVARGGKLGSGNSTTTMKGRKTNIITPQFQDRKANIQANTKAIQAGVKSKPTGTTGTVRKRKQTSPARKFVAQTGKSAQNIKASDALAKRGTSGSSTLGLTDPIRKAGSNVAKANTRIPLSTTDTLKSTGTRTLPGTSGSMSTTPKDIQAAKIETRDLKRAQTDLKAAGARMKQGEFIRRGSADFKSSQVIAGIKRKAGQEAKASARAGSLTPSKQTGRTGGLNLRGGGMRLFPGGGGGGGRLFRKFGGLR